MPAQKVTACCSAMPTSKQRLGKRSPKSWSPVPSGIAAVTATMRSSALGLADQRLREDLGVGSGAFEGFFCCAPVTTSNFATPWYLSADASAGGIALALPRQRVDQHRPARPRLHRAQDADQLLDVVAVDRPDVGEAELLEERAADRHALDQLARPPSPPPATAAAAAAPRPSPPPSAPGTARRRRAATGSFDIAPTGGEIDISLSFRTTMSRFLHVAGVVHRLVGHARRHRPVADHADHVADVRRAEVARHREAEPRRDRGRGMRRAERVVGALRPPGEAREARRRRAACGCGRAGRSGSCADRPGGRRPRSACPSAR